MKKNLIVIAFVIGTVSAHAQQNDIASEINKLEQAAVRAILKQDTLALKKLWAPDMMVNAPINKVVTGGQIKMVASGFIKY